MNDKKNNPNVINFIEELYKNYRTYFIIDKQTLHINHYQFIQLYIETFYKDEGSLVLYNLHKQYYNGITISVLFLENRPYFEREHIIHNNNINHFTIDRISIDFQFINLDYIDSIVLSDIENIFKLNYLFENIYNGNHSIYDYEFDKENTIQFIHCYIQSIKYILLKKEEYPIIQIYYNKNRLYDFSKLIEFYINNTIIDKTNNDNNNYHYKLTIYCIFEYKYHFKDTILTIINPDFCKNKLKEFKKELFFISSRYMFIKHDDEHFLHIHSLKSIKQFISHLHDRKEYLHRDYLKIFENLFIDHIRYKRVKVFSYQED